MFFFTSIFFILNIIIYLSKDHLVRIINLYDVPDNNRKVHDKKIPLIGGTIILINLAIFILLVNFNIVKITVELQSRYTILLFISVLFFILGFIDDKIDLKPLIKTFISIILFGLFLFLNQEILINKINFSFHNKVFLIDSHFSQFFFTIFCFLLFQNALNMFDGINLQSGLYALIFITFLFLKTPELIFIPLFSALILFIYLNYKNFTFLGDNGVYILAFILTFLILSANKSIVIFSDHIFILMSLPGIDMLRLFIIRIKKNKNPFNADKNHIHHILLKKFGYKETIIRIFLNVIFPVTLIYLNVNFYLVLFIFICLYLYNLGLIKFSR